MDKIVPFVSAIIITHNRAHYMSETISSVLSQTYENWELIVLDDGSTDNTENVVRQFNDERIHYYSMERIGIISEVRNRSLKLAKGEYIAFLDDDDIWEDNKLQTQIDLLLLKNADVLFNNSMTFYTDGSEALVGFPNDITSDTSTEKILDHLIYNRLVVYSSALIFKKSVLEIVNGYETSISFSELEFVGRLLLNCKVVAIPEPLVRIRKHDMNLSKQWSADAYFKEKFLFIDNLLDRKLISKTQYDLSSMLHYQSLIRCNNRSVSLTKAMGYFLHCLKINPWAIKNYTAISKRILYSMYNFSWLG